MIAKKISQKERAQLLAELRAMAARSKHIRAELGISGLLFEIALVLVRLDHVASVIVNANHSVMSAAVKLRAAYCITGCVWLAIPPTTEWQRIGN